MSDPEPLLNAVLTSKESFYNTNNNCFVIPVPSLAAVSWLFVRKGRGSNGIQRLETRFRNTTLVNFTCTYEQYATGGALIFTRSTFGKFIELVQAIEACSGADWSEKWTIFCQHYSVLPSSRKRQAPLDPFGAPPSPKKQAVGNPGTIIFVRAPANELVQLEIVHAPVPNLVFHPGTQELFLLSRGTTELGDIFRYSRELQYLDCASSQYVRQANALSFVRGKFYLSLPMFLWEFTSEDPTCLQIDHQQFHAHENLRNLTNLVLTFLGLIAGSENRILLMNMHNGQFSCTEFFQLPPGSSCGEIASDIALMKLFVLDSHFGAIWVYDNGNWQSLFLPDYQLLEPQGMCLLPNYAESYSTLLIADSGHQRILRVVVDLQNTVVAIDVIEDFSRYPEPLRPTKITANQYGLYCFSAVVAAMDPNMPNLMDENLVNNMPIDQFLFQLENDVLPGFGEQGDSSDSSNSEMNDDSSLAKRSSRNLAQCAIVVLKWKQTRSKSDFLSRDRATRIVKKILEILTLRASEQTVSEPPELPKIIAALRRAYQMSRPALEQPKRRVIISASFKPLDTEPNADESLDSASESEAQTETQSMDLDSPTGLKEQEPSAGDSIVPTASKPSGRSPGAIFQVNGKSAVGLINMDLNRFPKSSLVQGIAIASAIQKIANDLYGSQSEGDFLVPRCFVANYDILNPFTENHRFAQQVGSLVGKQGTCPWVFSFVVDGYQSFSHARTKLKLGQVEHVVSFVEYIQRVHRPPETLLTEQGDEVLIHGLVELLAVGRALGDIDILGSNATKAGYVWERDSAGKITGARAVKVDPKKSFTVNEDCKNMNLVLRTKNQVLSDDGSKHRWLEDLKNIQTGHSNQNMVVHWNALTPIQNRNFFDKLKRCLELGNERFQELNAAFRTEFKNSETELPQNVVTKLLADLRTWFGYQTEIYHEGTRIPENIKPSPSAIPVVQPNS